MRKNVSKQEFAELKAQLKMLSGKRGVSLAERFSGSVSLINDFLVGVRSKVVSAGFKDELEEVYFFKFEKPEYYAQKIFHVEVYALENGKPCGTSEMIRGYYLQELAFIARFFKQQGFYYGYFRSGLTQLDEQLFLRSGDCPSFLVAEAADLDPEFSTAGDYLFAKFMAYELLQEYILSQLKALDAGNVQVLSPAPATKKWFVWTGEVINLVELGYALYVSGQMDGGKASLAAIFRWLEECFGVEIGIAANKFREIRRRKRISRTHFLELLRDDLVKYMDKSDED